MADELPPAANEIRQWGLRDFRGSTNGIGAGYTDSQFHDMRCTLNRGIRRAYKFILERVYPFSTTFSAQVALTRFYASEMTRVRRDLTQKSRRANSLMEEYVLPDSVACGCMDWCEFDDKQVSMHYLELLDVHDRLRKTINFSEARSLFEIGGGFGVNTHLVIENYANLRKFVYLDIPPNLYVGTQYLKSFYPAAVRDYRETRTFERIQFSNTEDLEIICIAPWQIEKLFMKIDIFQNSHSFVEMPVEIVQNYARHVNRILAPGQNAVALVSYDQSDSTTTFHPNRLAEIFSRKFMESSHENLLGDRLHYYLVSVT